MGGLNKNNHDYNDNEYHGNKRSRQRAKGSIGDRLDRLESILLQSADQTKLTKKEKDYLKKLKKDNDDHPEKDD